MFRNTVEFVKLGGALEGLQSLHCRSTSGSEADINYDGSGAAIARWSERKAELALG
jgi:hypothetical protein